jgi:hypothetical protein
MFLDSVVSISMMIEGNSREYIDSKRHDVPPPRLKSPLSLDIHSQDGRNH